MIVAVTADRREADSPVSSHFGSSRFFVLHNTDLDEREIVQNPYADSLGDAGIQAAQMLIERNVGTVITGGIGGNELRVLSAANVKVYLSHEKDITEAITLFLRGKLRCLPDTGPADRRPLRGRRRRRLGGND